MMSEQRFVHYMVGNAVHDHQHWDLFKQMDALVAAIQCHQPCGDLMDAIISAMKLHFIDEDEFMVSNQYPYIDAHRADHSRMVRRLTTLVDDASRSSFGSVASIHTLEDTFLEHITYHDMPCMEWCKKKASSLSVEPSLPGQAS